MAGYCIRVNSPEHALQNRLRALEAAVQMRDSLKMATQWFGIGIVYGHMNKPEEALQYYLSATGTIERSGDKDRMARIYSMIGTTYHKLKNDSLALSYLGKSLALRREIDYKEGILASLLLTRSIFLDNGDYDNALEYTQEMLKLEESRDNKSGVAGCYNILGNIHEKKYEIAKAAVYYNKALEAGLAIDDKAAIRDAYKNLASILEKTGDKMRSYEYYKQHIALKDSLTALETQKKIQNLEALLDVEAKNHEIELLSKDKDISRLELEKKEKDISGQRKTLAGLAVILVATLAVAGLVFAGYRQKKRTAKNLAEQKKIIEEKSRLVEEKNKDITDSIRYAEKIQQAMQPSQKMLAEALPESFILYKPKDIVSGDFYWFSKKDDLVFIAAADCTGHGVPGALMSMVGLNFMNQLVNERGMNDTSAILDALHASVISALNAGTEERSSKDGMDIALLKIDMRSRTAQFSGAARPLCYVNEDGLQVIKGDRFSIGGVKEVNGKPFSSTTLPLNKPAAFYMFSDGYVDQFGGKDGKKLMMKNLQALLLDIQPQAMNEQRTLLEKHFESWKGKQEQVDDVLVIGVKV